MNKFDVIGFFQEDGFLSDKGRRYINILRENDTELCLALINILRTKQGEVTDIQMIYINAILKEFNKRCRGMLDSERLFGKER